MEQLSLGELTLELALIDALHWEAERLMASDTQNARPSPVKGKSGRSTSTH